MNIIRKTINFIVSDKYNLTERTINYFEESGFKHTDTIDEKLKFERGSVFSNMVTFNPLKWKSEIFIDIIDRRVIAEFNINTAGQIPTQKEEELWNNFIDNYQEYLNNSDFNFTSKNENILKSTKNNSIKYVGWAILGGIIFGIPAGFIAYWTGIDSIDSIGGAGGAIWIVTKKINDDKRKSAL